MSDDETAARLRLGMWLAAEPGRTWEHYPGENTVRVCSGMQAWSGTGPTLADAILAALDLINTNDEPNGPDDVTREDFARDEWRR